MNKVKIFVSAMIFSSFFMVGNASADIEISAIIPEKLKLGIKKAGEALETAQAMQQAADTAVQVGKEGINNATGLAEMAKDPTALATTAIETGVSTAMSSMQGVLGEDSNATEEETIKKVDEMYKVEYNAPMSDQRAHQEQINKLNGIEIARLFARSRALRVAIAEEEPYDLSDVNEKSIAELQAMNKELQIKTTTRWNKMLEMEAFINEYKGATAEQNYRREITEENENENQS